jgi:hypothetical protein
MRQPWARGGLVTGLAAALILAAAPTAIATPGPGSPSGTAARASSFKGLVVWSGRLGSETGLRGVVLKANGQGSILEVTGSNRGGNQVHTVAAFKPAPAAVAAIKSAAASAARAPRVSIGDPRLDGTYAALTVQVGSKKHVVLGVNQAPAALQNVLAALNAALPPTGQLRAPAPGKRLGKLIDHSDGTAPCPPGQAATTAAQPVSLKDAAASGIATLTTKGGFGGDTVAVDANWAPLDQNHPVKVRMNFEILPPPELSAADQARVVSGLKASVESRLSGLKASDGTPLQFELNVRQRDAGQPPRPCFHEISINQDVNPDVTSAINTKVDMTGPFAPDPLPGYGSWSTLGTSWQTGGGFSDKAANIWTHEALHFAGLDEAYHNAFQVDGVIKDFPVDARFQGRDDVLEWARQEEAFKGLDVNSGKFRLLSDPGHEHDFMGRCPDNPPCHVDQAAVDALVAAGRDNIDIVAAPGDLLLNKNTDQQDLGVGTDFHLLVHRGTPAHVDGLVAYCVNLDRHTPDAGIRLDVLGRAGDQADPSFQALQAVLDEVARRQTSPLAPTEGGQLAVWRVTDNFTESEQPGTSSREILDAANIAPDGTYQTPRFEDPNAGGAGTGAVTPSGVLPATPPGPAPPPPAVEAKPNLTALAVQGLFARRQLLILRIEDAAPDTVTVRLQKRSGRRTKTIRRYRAAHLHGGANFIPLKLPRLARGTYGIAAAGTGSTRTTSFKVR